MNLTDSRPSATQILSVAPNGLVSMNTVPLTSDQLALGRSIDKYERLYFGTFPFSIQGLYCSTIEELYRIAGGAVRTNITYFMYEDCFGQLDFDVFLSFCKEFPTFMSSIREVSFHGRASQFYELAAVADIHNIVDLELYGASTFTMAKAMPNLEHLYFNFQGRHPAGIECLPKSLKSLVIDECGDPIGIELPPLLERLVCFESYGDIWQTYPESLQYLKFQETYFTFGMCVFPDQLYELSFWDCGIQSLSTIRWPQHLKILDFRENPLYTLVGAALPDSIEVLKILSCSISSLDGVVFPRMLRTLDLYDNEISSFDGALFPPHLEVIKVLEQQVQTWSKGPFPDTLRVLELQTLEDPKSLIIPFGLETLTLVLPESFDGSYCDFMLPSSLQALSIYGGCSTEFEWNLPNLQKFHIEPFRGFVLIPNSVTNVAISSQDASLFQDLVIPANVENLELSYPVNTYPRLKSAQNYKYG